MTAPLIPILVANEPVDTLFFGEKPDLALLERNPTVDAVIHCRRLVSGVWCVAVRLTAKGA